MIFSISGPSEKENHPKHQGSFTPLDPSKNPRKTEKLLKKLETPRNFFLVLKRPRKIKTPRNGRSGERMVVSSVGDFFVHAFEQE